MNNKLKIGIMAILLLGSLAVVSFGKWDIGVMQAYGETVTNQQMIGSHLMLSPNSITLATTTIPTTTIPQGR